MAVKQGRREESVQMAGDLPHTQGVSLSLIFSRLIATFRLLSPSLARLLQFPFFHTSINTNTHTQRPSPYNLPFFFSRVVHMQPSCMSTLTCTHVYVLFGSMWPGVRLSAAQRSACCGLFHVSFSLLVFSPPFLCVYCRDTPDTACLGRSLSDSLTVHRKA